MADLWSFALPDEPAAGAEPPGETVETVSDIGTFVPSGSSGSAAAAGTAGPDDCAEPDDSGLPARPSFDEAVELGDSSGYAELWSTLLPIGLDHGTTGYRRFAWTAADLACREWFAAQAGARGLAVQTDRNGNQWAWWEPVATAGHPATPNGSSLPALAVGSHLDSVPDGGAFDGPLGVVCALAAVDLLRKQGWSPSCPVVVANFADEEGARFGVACAGSRLLTGQLDPASARELRDGDGTTLAAAMAAAGRDPELIGPDPALLGRIGAFVELHIEQGRALVDRSAPLGLASSIWPHGRWRFDFTGQANHAGTTRLDDRHDPMVTYAHTVLAARKRAAAAGALATFGRLRVEPNGTNAIPSRVRAWLDSRAQSEETLDSVLAGISASARAKARQDGTEVRVVGESRTALVEFDPSLRDRLGRSLGKVPVLATGAGHDAGILAHSIPTAMMFVRNPTGLSHAPGEHARTADCLAAVPALARVIADLAGAKDV
jgi:beta-ureidopropionase / N-carbamoyl-L-amino-acid hydrolase